MTRSAITEPGRNDPLVIAALALSVFVFAYSTRFGALSILLLYALWFPLALLVPGRVVWGLATVWPITAFAALAVLSVFWSDAPGSSLRTGVQLATHVLCAVIAARVASLRAFALGGLAGTLLVLVWSILFGRYSYDLMDGTYTFVGLFSSKNQLGFFASLAALFAGFLLHLERRPLWRAGFLLAGALAVLVLVRSASVTSMIALMAAGGTLLAVLSARHVRASTRLVLLAAGLVGGGALAALLLEAGAVAAVLDAFGKDATLTGRTYLWGEGMEVFAEAPVVGHGYAAFWVQGFAHAERLWAEFYITARTGFHFHNTWVETLVELGVLGTALVAWAFASTTLRAVWQAVRRRTPAAPLSVALMVLLIARSFSEVDTTAPYTIGSFLLVWTALAARRPHPALSDVARRSARRTAPLWTPAREVSA